MIPPGAQEDLRLAMLWRVAPRHLRVILGHLEAGRLSFPWSGADLDRLPERLPPGMRQELLRIPDLRSVERTRGILERWGIAFLVRGRPGFPPDVEAISDPPPFLFTRGEVLGLPRRPRVGIIGSRAASASGREIAYGLARDLALAGCEIVSGLARGIDGEAHAGACDAGGRTIAVLGTGADGCYPPEHRALMEDVLRHGGLVTEFPPETPPLRLHFPRRNRILAALCDALVVVEGGERSGARSTVDHALDQGKEVLAVPRDIVHPGSTLPNRLIRDGAAPVLQARDVLEAIRRIPGARAGGAAGPGVEVVAGEERPGAAADGAALAGVRTGPAIDTRILSALANGSVSFEACLRAAAPAGAGEVQAALLRLEMGGWIRRLAGGRFESLAAPAR